MFWNYVSLQAFPDPVIIAGSQPQIKELSVKHLIIRIFC